MNIKFDLAQSRDLPAILRISNAVILGSPANFHLKEESLADIQKQFDAAQGIYPWIVAMRQGEVVAFAKAGRYRMKAAYDRTTETTIYIDEACRGHHLGTALYERLLTVLEMQGYRSAIGCITRPNEPSEALHLKLGFELTGVIRDAGWKYHQWWDVAFWQKQWESPNPEGDDLRAELLSPAVAWTQLKHLDGPRGK